jgi:RNA polymerase sigma-70 factor (ECF subfamily)
LAGHRTEREFERIVRSTEAQIRAYVAGMGIAIDEVDDLAQEVYIALYRGMDSRPEGVEQVRWLKGIARNLCMNHFRQQKRRAYRQREAIAELLANAKDAFWEVEGAGAPQIALEGCLKKLSPANRELIALRYEQGLRSQEIGESVNKSAEAVRVNLHRIRATLKTCIVRTLSEAT